MMEGPQPSEYPAIERAQRLAARRLGRGKVKIRRQLLNRTYTGTETSQNEQRQLSSEAADCSSWIWYPGPATVAAPAPTTTTNADVRPKSSRHNLKRRCSLEERRSACLTPTAYGDSNGRGGKRSEMEGRRRREAAEDRRLSPSLERTLRDMDEVSLKVREDSLALEHFLADEAAPTVQKVFSAAVYSHARACHLLSAENTTSSPRRPAPTISHRATAPTPGTASTLPSSALRARKQSRRDLTEDDDTTSTASTCSPRDTDPPTNRKQKSYLRLSPTRGSNTTAPANNNNTSSSNDNNNASVLGVASNKHKRRHDHHDDSSGTNGVSGGNREGSSSAGGAALSMASATHQQGRRADVNSRGNNRERLGRRTDVNESSTVGGGGSVSGGGLSETSEMGLAVVEVLRVSAMSNGGGGRGGAASEGGDETDGSEGSASRPVTTDVTAKIVGLSTLIRKKAAETAANRRRQN